MSGVLHLVAWVIVAAIGPSPAERASLRVVPSMMRVGDRLSITVVLPAGVDAAALPPVLASPGFVVTDQHDLTMAGRSARVFDAVAAVPGDYDIGPLRLPTDPGGQARGGILVPGHKIRIMGVVGAGGRAEVQPLMGRLVPADSSGGELATGLIVLFVGFGLLLWLVRRRRRVPSLAEAARTSPGEMARLRREMAELTSRQGPYPRSFYRRLGRLLREVTAGLSGVATRQMTGPELLERLAGPGGRLASWQDRIGPMVGVIERGGFGPRAPGDDETRQTITALGALVDVAATPEPGRRVGAGGRDA